MTNIYPKFNLTLSLSANIAANFLETKFFIFFQGMFCFKYYNLENIKEEISER